MYIHIYLFIHLCRFFFYYCAYVCYLLWNYFMRILLYMIMCMLLSATSTHFKWELMLYCLHCPTLNKVFLLLLLLVLLRMTISMLKIRRPLGRLIFNMGIAIPGKTVFLIETAPRTLLQRFTPFVSNPIWIVNCDAFALIIYSKIAPYKRFWQMYPAATKPLSVCWMFTHHTSIYSIFQNQGTPSCLGAASSCLVWPRLALPCHALSCLVLSCLGLNVTLFRQI